MSHCTICCRRFPSAVLAAALLAGTVAATSQAADPESLRQIQLSGHAMSVPVPDGYCPIDPNDPAQSSVAKQVEAASGGQVDMLTFDVSCPALEAFAANGGGAITPYAIHYAVLENGRPAVYDGSRQAFVQETVGQLAGPELRTRLDATAREVDAATQRRLDALDQRSERAVTVEGTQVQEPLGHDENAIYIGFISRFTTEAGPRATAGVTGMTVVDGVVTTVNMYRDYEDSRTLQMLLKDTQTQVASVVAANGG